MEETVKPPAPDLRALSTQLVAAVARAAASVVQVRSRPGGPASGVAIAPDLVLTVDHVVDADPAAVRVGLPDGRTVDAQIVGRDVTSDLALLRVPGAGLTPAEPAEEPAQAGMLALVVARPAREPLASWGMVAGAQTALRTPLGGLLEAAIRIDAVLYPGFSGGLLIDTAGAALGVISSRHALAGPAVAVPWELAARLATALATHGRVSRGYLGIASQPVSLDLAGRAQAGGQEQGLLIVATAEGSPAATAGVRQGDIVIRLDGTAVPAPGAVDEPDDVFMATTEPLEAMPRPPVPPGANQFFMIRAPFPTGGGPMPPFPPPPPGAPWDLPRPGAHRVMHYRIAGQAPSGPGHVDELQAFLGPDRIGATL
ncbi:MAG: serine protease DegQ, partial [Chloroflexota bacterium]|nr:serine protease DegQ [Chloroflexota bacterium]